MAACLWAENGDGCVFFGCGVPVWVRFVLRWLRARILGAVECGGFVMSEMPKNIYLQSHDEDNTPLDLNSDRVTWCTDKVYGNDTRYVLAEDVERMATVFRAVLDDCASVGVRPLSADRAEDILSEFEKPGSTSKAQLRLAIGADLARELDAVDVEVL